MSPGRKDRLVRCDERNRPPLRDILDPVGDKWNIHIIALLHGGTLRFHEIRRLATGGRDITRTTLNKKNQPGYR